MLAPGTQLGPYKITAPLGAGGMGEVYRAADSRLGREVAVKVLAERFAGDAELRGRFEREAQAVASLSHPNILAIHDFGTEGTSTYAVMELLEGQTLRARLTKGALPWRKAVEFGIATAEGLAAAHAKGITHRDLKPENLFLTSGGSLKILDFGLAQIKPLVGGLDATSLPASSSTEPGTVLGTVGYMAPEQVRGQPADVRSDIFSLGCVLYEMVTGQRAFADASAAETMALILHEEPADIGSSGKQVPLEVERVIQHCLEKGRDERFQSARDLSFALKAILSDSNASGVRTGARGPERPSAVVWMAVAGALLALGAIGVFLLAPALRPVATTKAAGTSGLAFQSLAILPLTDVTGDAKGEPLCEGIAEQMSSSLSRVGDLKVRPITSTMHYRGQKVDAKTVGRELDVQAIVTGRLRQEGETLIIALELVNARDNSLVWSHQYKGTRQQILDLQDTLSRDLASKLGLQLTGAEEQRLTKRYTEDPEAYVLYREGQYHWRKFSEEGLKTAIEYFRRAIQKDSKYALAHVGLGQCYVLLGTIHHGPRETFPEARKYVDRALAIDDSVALAHYMLGVFYLFDDWNWPAAEREFKRAIALDPNHASQHLYGFYLAAMGRPSDAIPYFQRDKELAPLVAQKCYELAMGYNWAGQYDKAIDEAGRAVELDPNFFLAYGELSVAYTQKGMHKEALAELRKVPHFAKGHPGILGRLGYAHAVAGQRDEAQNVLDELKDPARFRFGCAFAMTMIHAALGEKDQAFKWLKKACDERHPHVVWVKVDPTLDNLRSDPRFELMLQDMRLAEKPATQDQGIQSVAVLPLENIGGDPKTEFLSDGLAYQISNSLLQVRRENLKVRPFSSVARYKTQRPPFPSIARDLNVQAIVTGSLHQQGDDLSIGVELVDAREDNRLWGKRYQGKLSEILDLQDQIARDVAENLRLRLTGQEEQRLTKRDTKDPEAYLLYREGMHHWHKFTEEGLTTAIEYFERAIKQDPNYAPAHQGLADCYGVLGVNFWSPKENIRKSIELTRTALKLDNSLAEAHANLALMIMSYERDLPAAEREIQLALQLGPQSPGPHHLFAIYLVALGRFPEAITQIKAAIELDPQAPVHTSFLCLTYLLARQYEQSIAESQRMIEKFPGFPFNLHTLGRGYLHQGKYDAAVATLEQARTINKDHPRVLGPLGFAYARSGKRDEADELLRQLVDLASEQRVPVGLQTGIAMIHVGLGDREQALAWLQKAHEAGEPWLFNLKVDPFWDDLRSDPGFEALAREMGLGETAITPSKSP